MTIRAEEVPYIEEDERVEVLQLSGSFWRVMAYYGFKETPDVQQILDLCAAKGLAFELMDTSFFLSRETLIQTEREGLSPWRETLFVWMSRNALRATDFFQIPTNRVVEMGAQVEL
ncbi:potassium transport protein Kup [compost metagenome]